MRIRELLSTGRPSFSFEFFPPKDEAGFDQLRATIGSLRELRPTYVSVTYGAGGGTRRKTIELVASMRKEYGVEAMAHLTCVGASRSQLLGVLECLDEAGVDNVLPLRGDPPEGSDRFEPHPEGLSHASELTALARRYFDFCLGGACYPEGHPESPERGGRSVASEAQDRGGVRVSCDSAFLRQPEVL